MNGQKAYRIATIILRVKLGNATDEERLQLLDWLDESEGNRRTYKRIIRGEALRERIVAEKKISEEADYEQIKQRVVARLIGNKRRRRIQRWGTVAAAFIALVLGSGLVAYHLFRTETGFPRLAQEKVIPGKLQATLILSSGQKVPLDTARYELKEIDGTAIRITSGGGVSYRATASEQNRQPLYNTMLTPKGGEYSMQLEDGTKVWLNAATELRYPVTFDEDQRVVYLKGEAYFSVVHQEGKPFIVYSDDARIEVLGTEFNVRNYQDESVATTLVKGAVWVTDRSGNPGKHLSPGQQAVFGDRGIEVKEVEPMHYTAWKDGFFVYQDKKLDTILKELARWYDFTYLYRDAGLQDIVLTAKIKKYDGAERIFEVLSATGQLGFEIQGQVVTVYAK